ncbi:TPA: hypothetical protein JG855_004202 [Vibrio parahaemolyticus]|uniref:hypothetical protein n=1 Tax=Vibrio parahaemolyticus TaxID=670 RepID=UPI001121735C|nr:hypothetical protein [Vibrio parahaemolyticus]EJV0371038.1 hypothetical protein [Vibrio vulnificus]EGQ9919322.1 hypothetical protein [Vibrio parahaemolyticus]MDF4357883.1 hypothetical protein [Vibrio parahaemolyticus]MDF4545104.1 hypothetical protein [Vibrio parahaemolyticus]MDG2580050.1 hypothetical protein [Vibrio parahaemolyticus]
MDSIVNFFMGFITAFQEIRNPVDLGMWLLTVIAVVLFPLAFLLKIGILEVNFKKFLLAGCVFSGFAVVTTALGLYDNLGAALIFFAFIWLLGIPFKAYKKDEAEA